jgi:hypothetical protein
MGIYNTTQLESGEGSASWCCDAFTDFHKRDGTMIRLTSWVCIHAHQRSQFRRTTSMRNMQPTASRARNASLRGLLLLLLLHRGDARALTARVDARRVRGVFRYGEGRIASESSSSSVFGITRCPLCGGCRGNAVSKQGSDGSVSNVLDSDVYQRPVGIRSSAGTPRDSYVVAS